MIYLVIGRREQGKTTLVAHMADKMPQRAIFDPRGILQRGAVARTVDELREAMAALKAGEISEFSYTPRGDSRAGFIVFSNEIAEWVDQYPMRPLAVVVDEIAFADVSCESFQWVARCCKRDYLHIFVTCHRPSDVDTSLRAISDHWLIFPCRQEHDLDVIRKRCNAEVVEHVQGLTDRHFVHWNDSAGTYTIVKRPEAWYVPLHAQGSGDPLPPVTRDLGGEIPTEKKSLARNFTLPL